MSRELRCPICDSHECQIDGENTFDCDSCGAVLQNQTEEKIFEIHDKLNPKEG